MPGTQLLATVHYIIINHLLWPITHFTFQIVADISICGLVLLPRFDAWNTSSSCLLPNSFMDSLSGYVAFLECWANLYKLLLLHRLWWAHIHHMEEYNFLCETQTHVTPFGSVYKD